MKKILMSFLITLIMVLPWVTASANSDMGISVSIDNASDAITVMGVINDSRGTIPLTLEITDSLQGFVGGAQTLTVRKDGVSAYQFEEIYLPSTIKTDTYTFTVSGHFLDRKFSASMKYFGVDALYEAILSVQQSTDKYNAVTVNAELAGFSQERFAALSADARKVFNSVMAAKSYTLPNDYLTEENADKMRRQGIAFKKDVKEALMLAEFEEISAKKDFLAWYNEYYSLYGLDVDNDITPESEKQLTFYVELVREGDGFIRLISDEAQLTTIKQVATSIYQNALLTVIATQNDYHIINIVKKFTRTFPSLQQLSAAQLAQGCQSAARKDYATLGAFADAVLEHLNPTQKGTSNNTSGSAWGTSKGEGPSAPIIAENTVNKTEESIPLFNDVSKDNWSYNAIINLAKDKILSGRSENIFEPNAPVTRAEFVKIIVAAKKLTLINNEDAVFSDVSKSEWYAPYIAAAKNAGFIHGTHEGEFLPNESITRQDMAVMLFRAFEMDGEYELEFSDSTAISEYAKKAVATMQGKKIISGMGDGTFMPLAIATRAQAAVVIYNILY
jgi:hypothetical protein